jgi:OmpA-OmpF porin, OOP family
MKNVFASLLMLFLLTQDSFAQNMSTVRPSAFGVSFVLNDFTTANRIRSGSLAKVVRDKKWAKFSEMSPGLALTYFKGLQDHLDFAGTLAGSFVNYPFPSRPSSGNDNLLLEGDVSLNYKLLGEQYLFTPYLSAGIGGSEFKNYWGAFIPVGLGMKLNLFDQTSLFVQTQYKIGVTTENTNYHFMYSIGVSGSLGKHK